jgi:hypothetical protein
MRLDPWIRCALVGLAPCLFAVLTGCNQPVRENRTITWSADGKAVGFQHGADGVFVAGPDGKGLRKIFQPGPDVLATSPPRWSPAGRRLLFTTARAAEPDPAANQPAPGDPDPAGRTYQQRPVVYTCWLWAESPAEPPPQPVRLFEAACDHVGYVAADLAVRWHPQGDRVLYVHQVAGQGHGLFEYDLNARTSRRIFVQPGEALIFDWSPDQAHLACVVGGTRPDPEKDGIWIGRPEGAAWWHVPQSEALAAGPLPAVLERLQATRPTWTPDGSRFAFRSFQPGPDGAGGRHFLRLGTPATQQVQTVASGPSRSATCTGRRTAGASASSGKRGNPPCIWCAPAKGCRDPSIADPSGSSRAGTPPARS